MAIKASASITVSIVAEVAACYRYYLLQSSTLAAPAVPTANPPSGWDDTEPTYTAGSTSSLYTVDLTVYSDGTWSYSEVSLSSSYEAAKTAYNKAVAAQNAAESAGSTASTALEQSVEYIVGTQTKSTNAWTGVTTSASLYVGKTIAYKLPYAGTSSAATLNLTLSGGTTTGAKSIRRANSTVTTQFPAGTVITLTYDGTYWCTTSINSDTYDRVRYSNAVKVLDAGTAYPYIMVGASDGYKIAAADVSFDVSYPVLAYSSSTDLTAGATTTNMYTQLPTTTLRNNVADWTGTQYAMAYIVGTLSGKTFTIGSAVFTSDVPTEADGLAYVPIGVLVNAYQVYFKSDATVYAYGDNGFAPVSVNAQSAADAAQGDADSLSDAVGGIRGELDTAKEDIVGIQNSNAEVYEVVYQNQSKISELVQVSSGFEMSFQTITDSITQINDQYVTDRDEQYKYIRFIDGEIWIGKLPEEGEDDLQLVMRNDRISFLMNNVEIAYFSDDALYVTNVTVTGKLVVGRWEWSERSNGNLGLKWIGGDS